MPWMRSGTPPLTSDRSIIPMILTMRSKQKPTLI